MEANSTVPLANMEENSTIPLTNMDLFSKHMRSINLGLSCAGVLSNFILLIILLRLKRHQCTTYFILVLMTMCDFLYCTVYTSILLTIDSYLNIINHQILCPLSFFLSPFTFTGSTLLLLICLLHLVTDYIRRYDTMLGQIGGRLSVVFVFAFVIVRSVLGSTSIELMSDASMPHIQHCTIDMNTPEIVTKIQTINHIFAEVTDILVYIGWIALLIIYLTSFIPRNKSQAATPNSSPLATFLTEKNNRPANEGAATSKERHKDLSLIIVSISIISILFYLPVMTNKFTTMSLVYLGRPFFSDYQIFLLQVIQQTTHLFCLTMRFLPYFLFDRSIRLVFHQMVGMKIQRKKSSKRLQKYICRCQCSQRHSSLELNGNEHKHAEV